MVVITTLEQRDLNDDGKVDEWENTTHDFLIPVTGGDDLFGGTEPGETGTRPGGSDDFYIGGGPGGSDDSHYEPVSPPKGTPILDTKNKNGQDKTDNEMQDSIGLIDSVFDNDTGKAHNSGGDSSFTDSEIVTLLKAFDLNDDTFISDDELQTILDLKKKLAPADSNAEKDILTSFKDYLRYAKIFNPLVPDDKILDKIEKEYLNLIDLDGNGTTISSNEKQIAREVFNFYKNKTGTTFEVALLQSANKTESTRNLVKKALVDNDAASTTNLKRKFAGARINP